VLTHLFIHTGERGFLEAWQLEQKLIQPSRIRCLSYRFPEWCRWVWYGVVVACAIGMMVYILEIALMFDQNPYYYCHGEATTSWLLDFIFPYLISTLGLEPLKIALVITSKRMLQDMTPTRDAITLDESPADSQATTVTEE